MTLRSFFRILWLQKLLILFVTGLVLTGAALYTFRSEVAYVSNASVTAAAAAVAVVEGSGVDGFTVDPSVLSSQAVTQAAASLGMNSDAVAGAVAGSRVNGDSVSVVAVSAVPTQARQIADAYVAALVPELSAQVEAYAAELQTELDRLKQQIESLPNDSTDAVTASQVKVLSDRYSAVFGQYDAVSALSEPLEVTSASTAVKSGPSNVTALGVALLAGLLAGIGLALLRQWLDGRVFDAEDAAGTNAPVLGTVSRDRPTARSGRPGVAGIEFANGTVAEQVRRLRTTLDRMHADTGGVVVIAGVDRGAGATFLAANLATAAARAGQSTIVVSGNLRNPDISEYFGIVTDETARDTAGQRSLRSSRRAAVEDVSDQPDEVVNEVNGSDLNGSDSGRADGRSANLPAATSTRARMRPRGAGPVTQGAVARPLRSSRVEQWSAGSPIRGNGDVRLVSTGVEGLSLLPSLVGPKEGPDSLANVYVRDTVERLRTQADLVVIDGPPVLDYADAGILAGYGDELLLVAASRQTRIRALGRAVESLGEAGVKRVGIVVNQARGGRSSRRSKPKKGLSG